jgi:Asp-tRNA(Asn)/Glu-tRNA(Gln) amidotransferase C subunit
MYKNVLLSDEDLEKLKTEFSDWEQRIERLSEYIASAGKSYKNHLATIRSWARKDKDKKTYGKRTAEEKNEGFCFTQPTDDLPF